MPLPFLLPFMLDEVGFDTGEFGGADADAGADVAAVMDVWKGSRCEVILLSGFDPV